MCLEGGRSQIMGGPVGQAKEAMGSYERTSCREEIRSNLGFRKITSVNNNDN